MYRNIYKGIPGLTLKGILSKGSRLNDSVLDTRVTCTGFGRSNETSYRNGYRCG